MEKRKSIKTAFTLAIIFFIIKFALDFLLVFCTPIREIIWSVFGSRSYFKGNDFSAVTKTMYLAALSAAIIPKCILAFFNLGKTDLQKQRGLTTIILTAVFSVLSGIVSYLTNFMVARITSVSEYAMLSSMSILRTFTGILSSAATVILYCCGAIEIYNGAEKAIYPSYNGDINNTDNNLS